MSLDIIIQQLKIRFNLVMQVFMLPQADIIVYPLPCISPVGDSFVFSLFSSNFSLT